MSQHAKSIPGLDTLILCFAFLAALLGAPYVYDFLGPFIEPLLYQTYSRWGLGGAAQVTLFALFFLIIFFLCRIALWLAFSGTIAFGAMRLADYAV